MYHVSKSSNSATLQWSTVATIVFYGKHVSSHAAHGVPQDMLLVVESEKRPHVEDMWQNDLWGGEPDCVWVLLYSGQSCGGTIDE